MDSIKYLCRLCAKKEDISKDLMDANNIHVLKIIHEFINIAINESDNLPTRICLNCEEKMVSFQLFILECYKAQDTLKQLYLQSSNFEVKDEEGLVQRIKTEVKNELIAEDIVSTIGNEVTLLELESDFHDDDEKFSNDIGNDNDDDHNNYDDEDDVSIATLKEIKTQCYKKKVMTEEESIKFHEIIKKSNLKAKDFVKLVCNICTAEAKSWEFLQAHYFKAHSLSKPIVYCLCGFPIQSKSVLYKHVSDHKVESKKLNLKVVGKTHGEDESEWSTYSNLKVNDFVNFICIICQKKCSSWYTLKAHSRRSHKQNPIVHCSCGVTLRSKSVMYKHVHDHKNPNLIQCDMCPKTTRTLVAMAKHKLRHIPKNERKFCCSSCDKVYTSKEGLKSHLKSHIPIEKRKIYQCDLCDLKCASRSALAAHRRVVHERLKRFVCDLCGFACGTGGELRQHRAIHSDDKPYACPKCPKSFKTPSNLKSHLDTHDETSYTCNICNRILNSRRTLRKHLLVHEDKCTYVCSYCNRSFKRKQTLKVHMHTHTGDKPLSCQWCDERFSYASTLRTHRLRWHPEKLAQAHAAADYHDYGDAAAAAATAVHENYLKNEVAALAEEIEKNEADNL